MHQVACGLIPVIFVRLDQTTSSHQARQARQLGGSGPDDARSGQGTWLEPSAFSIGAFGVTPFGVSVSHAPLQNPIY
jgi:hypothetical protein